MSLAADLDEGRFTPEQHDAIVARDGNLLVAAAAGSGKTSVLVERVIRRILDRARPTPVDRLLVVTFTEAAAAEMRSRIARRLEQVLAERPADRAVREQLALLPRASISTIHSFCLRLVREHFHRLGLDPSAAVLDEHEARLMLAESLEAVFHARHAAEEPAFLALVRSYGGGEAPVAVKALVVALFHYTRSLARPDEWLDAAARRLADAARAGAVAATPYFAPVKRALEVELARFEAELAALAVAAVRPGGPSGYVTRLEADAAALAGAAAAIAAAPTFTECVAALAAISFGSLSPARGEVDEALKKWIQGRRNAIKAKVNGLTARLAGPDESDWLADLGALVPHAHALVALVRDLERRYTALKRRRSALDFDDLEHLALELLGHERVESGPLEPSAVALSLAERFEEVLVDEYQDVNGVQEAILALVSRDGAAAGMGNRFVVGDVKQSIYGFRHTDPSLFLARLASYQAGESGRAIVLARNFRSRPSVVDAVNFTFRQLMSEEVGGLRYEGDAELVYGAAYPDGASEPSAALAGGPVELHLVERGDAAIDGDDDGEAGESEGTTSRTELAAWLDDAAAAEREALVAASRARAIVEGDPATGAPPARVWERRGADGGWESRPARWGDVVVLLRSIKNRAPAYVQVFDAFGIPIHAEVGTGWFAVTEIGVMLALLQVLDNPRQDIPLAAVLLSPIGGFRAADLAKIRLADGDGDYWDAVRAAAGGAGSGSRLAEPERLRLAELVERIDGWRTAARRGPLSGLVWRIYGETRFLDVASAMPGGEQRRANLLALFDRAREFDHFARQGLARFLGFIAKLEERDEDLGVAAVLGAGDDVVRVMSIHKSKGLEFPFVVLAGLGTEWNDRDLEGDVLFDGGLGLGLRVVDLRLRARFPSLAHHAVKAARAAAMRAEELRVLYVAMTRARERLVMIGSARGLANECVRWVASGLRAVERLPPALVAAACRPLDWVVPAVARHPDARALREAAGLGGAAGVGAPSADRSRWEVRLWGRAELEAGAPRRSVATVARVMPDWPALAALDRRALRGAASHLAESDRDTLSARFAFRYPYAEATAHFAKLSVTELKARFGAGAPTDPDAAELSAARIEWPVRGPARGGRRAKGRPSAQASPATALTLEGWDRPRFLDTGVRRTASAAEAGIATHLVLRHLDPRRWDDAAAVGAALADMVADGRVSAEQAAAARLDAIVAFGRSPLGVRLAARADRLRREVPFTLGLPAAEVHPEIPSSGGGGDVIVVQGVIDLLVEVEDERGFLLLDYKTDRVAVAEVELASRRYRGQMALYARAVGDIFGRPVVESWLGFLSAGVAVQLPG